MLTTSEADEIADRISERREWVNEFKRSVKGNLSRRYNGKVLTVFLSCNGRYRCSVFDVKADGVRFLDSYELEGEALNALYMERGKL